MARRWAPARRQGAAGSTVNVVSAARRCSSVVISAGSAGRIEIVSTARPNRRRPSTSWWMKAWEAAG
jgi:hypothetical protein